MSDIIHRLNAHASAEHDGVNCEIGFEAAETIIDLRLEIERLTKERDAAIREIGPAFAEIERLKQERDRLYDREAELARRLATAEEFFADRPARRSECRTLDDWRMMAEHYEYQWSQCSSGYNSCVAKTIEQCAEVCSTVARVCNKAAKREGALQCAAAIRAALKEQP